MIFFGWRVLNKIKKPQFIPFLHFSRSLSAFFFDMRFYILLSFIIIFNQSAQTQLLQGTGSWRDHFPYSRTIAVCKAHGNVFCASPYGVFAYNTSDKSTTRISKANFLSDVGITAMEYDPYTDKVIVGYENGNLDLITAGSGVNLPDIRLSTIIGDKSIYDIFPYEDRVYLSTGFGIVVLDAKNLEVRETYYIGQNGTSVTVYDLAVGNGKIYAATEEGLKVADLNNPFLANFENWSLVTDVPSTNPAYQVTLFYNHLVLAINNGTNDLIWYKPLSGGDWTSNSSGEYYRVRKIWTDGYWMTIAGNFSLQILQQDFDYFHHVPTISGKPVSSNCCIIDEWAQAWSADDQYGLTNISYFDENSQLSVLPQGPRSADTRKLAAYNNNLWIAHGGITPYWGNLWNSVGVSAFVDEQWKGVSGDTLGNFSNCNNIGWYVADFMAAAIDPNDNNRVFMGSYDDGLIEMNGATMKGKAKNAPGGTSGPGPKRNPQTIPEYTERVSVAGLTFSNEGVLWCSNSGNPEALHALDRNGTFYDYNFSQILGTGDHIGEIIVGRNGYVYAVVIGKGLLVFNNNGTLGNYSDDNYKLMTDVDGDGNFPSKDVLSIEEDLDGEIWVGTAQGLAVIYSPESIFSDENYNAEVILIEQDGNTQELMGTEAINAIEIDGSNRKWIGTRNSGAFLFSDDGLRQIYHFNERNSAIPNNNIYDIAINHSNGEIFFGTEKGVVGFFSTATNFDNEMKEVKVFPNPVRPEYEGNITIDGLAYDTNVKITDIQGNIMYETTSEGGRAIWDGKRFDGERPSTGVYLIYVTDKNGKANDVKKITFIR